MTADPAAWLAAELARREKEAREIDPAWWVYSFHFHAPLAQSYGEVCSPAAVLRRIAADRKQLELHAAVPDHGRFSERDCEASGCDGEHEEPPVCRSCRSYAGDPIEAPCPTVEILATGWGWAEET